MAIQLRRKERMRWSSLATKCLTRLSKRQEIYGWSTYFPYVRHYRFIQAFVAHCFAVLVSTSLTRMASWDAFQASSKEVQNPFHRVCGTSVCFRQTRCCESYQTTTCTVFDVNVLSISVTGVQNHLLSRLN